MCLEVSNGRNVEFLAYLFKELLLCERERMTESRT